MTGQHISTLNRSVVALTSARLAEGEWLTHGQAAGASSARLACPADDRGSVVCGDDGPLDDDGMYDQRVDLLVVCRSFGHLGERVPSI
jgi:hypothetical protein